MTIVALLHLKNLKLFNIYGNIINDTFIRDTKQAVTVGTK